MKTVDIYLDNTYEKNTRTCKCIYYMSYKNAVIKRTIITGEHISYNRALLIALYEALQKMKEPCNIVVHSKQGLGFKQPRRSPNKDLIIKIQLLLNKAGHIFVIDSSRDFRIVNQWETKYNIKNEEYKVNTSDRYKKFNNVNDVFSVDTEEERKEKARIANEKLIEQEWKEILNERGGVWTPTSGGY